MTPLKNAPLVYAVFGALLVFSLSGKRRKTTKRVSSAIAGGAVAALVALLAPKFGVRLPGTSPALPAGRTT